MGEIIDWAKNEDELKDYPNVWLKWREVSKDITQYDEKVIRTLHAQFNMLASHLQLRVAILDTQKGTQELRKDLVESSLIASEKFVKEGVTIRRNMAWNDQKYKDEIMKLDEISINCVIARAELSALNYAIQGLSREMTARKP